MLNSDIKRNAGAKQSPRTQAELEANVQNRLNYLSHTPSVIASDLLWNALSLGDIENKNILDLGCGCGIFSIGSCLLGADSAIGIDIDEESINLALKTASDFSIDNIEFISSDVFAFDDDLNVDTIFQNPPFGSQKNAERGIDLEFVKKAREFDADVLYSFHMASTEEFLINYYENLSFESFLHE